MDLYQEALHLTCITVSLFIHLLAVLCLYIGGYQYHIVRTMTIVGQKDYSLYIGLNENM